MELLHGGYTLKLCKGAFPLSTDSMLLADFVRMPPKARILDLGSGCGTLGLLLCAKDPQCTVTGIELDPQAHGTALENILENGLGSRLKSMCADLRGTPQHFHAGSFSCCVANPPYFTSGPASNTTPLARRDDRCSMAELFHAAAWAVKFGGDFFLVHKPERLAELFACAHNENFEPKRLCLVRHRPDDPISLVLVQCRKGAKPGLLWEELCLFHADGQPTQEYKKIYHL